MPAQKINTKQLFFSVVITTLALGTFLPTPFSIAKDANAQMIMTAIPPRVDLKADPGQTITTQLKIRNDSESSSLFTITVDDFIVSDTKGTPIPVTTTAGDRWSLKNWISAPSVVPVDAGDIQLINVTIRVPMTALPGGHYAMVTYTPESPLKPGELKTTGNLISQRVGSLIYVTVNGPITQNANIVKFSVPQFTEQGPVDFSGEIQNLSDVHVNPTGTITISNPVNTKVAEIPVEVGNIFPEVTREFVSSWNQKYGWGRYRADLNLAYGTAGGILTATTFFWLFPIRMVIYSLILIASILIAIIMLNKRGKKHQEALEKEVQELKKELQEVEQH